jgi:hypothetical protein
LPSAATHIRIKDDLASISIYEKYIFFSQQIKTVLERPIGNDKRGNRSVCGGVVVN